MPQPTGYNRHASFTSLQQADPTGVTPGTSLDLEFNSVKQTLDETLSNLALIQRDDGALRNGIVTQYSLAASLSLGFTFRGVWAEGVAYVAADGVSRGSRFYICRVAGTSTALSAPELDSATWELAADFTSAALDAVNSMNTDIFSGDGSRTVFTLTSSPSSPHNMIVSISGVEQVGINDYSVSGSTLTFVTAPPLGTNNIYVRSFATVSVAGSISASLIQVSPAVAGSSTVQGALQNIDADVTSAAAVAASAASSASTATVSAAAAVATANAASVSATTANSTAGTALTAANAQVPFAKIDSTALASNADATAGTSNSKLMTPLRVAEAITALTTGSSSAGRLLGITRFTATGTWSKATLNPSFIVVKARGGGGGGGTVPSGSVNRVGAGGGAGGYSEKKILSASLGATETVTIGAGGAASSAGGNTTFGAHLTASGGAAGAVGGATQYSATGGAGGAASSGDRNVTGNPGFNGHTFSGAEPMGGNGGAGCNGGAGRGGYDQPTGAVAATAAAANTGSGGGGAATRNSTGRAGGAGGSGYIEVWEYS